MPPINNTTLAVAVPATALEPTFAVIHSTLFVPAVSGMLLPEAMGAESQLAMLPVQRVPQAEKVFTYLLNT